MKILVFETALGQTALARESQRIHALSFGHSSEQAAVEAVFRALSVGAEPVGADIEVESVCPGSDELVDRLCAYALGEPTRFDDLQVEESHLTPFGRQVIRACRGIACGETRTYGELARAVGRPGAARAVGSVMARNRVPLIVPCHRVVPASGGLGGFSAPQGVAMKQRLLEMEQGAAMLQAK